MLQIEGISKKYRTGDLVQTALDNVSLNFRDNEFVAILGPSGSGKTTLLNVIGGLDRYDSGDLIINSISTKRYKDRDWDSYRNHTIGFVFQSYNLIGHQSVLANVELALTISGISKSERKKRAKEALEKVGLGEQIHKKPNQMSGGQMQRVAIARALVNNPQILLADEPTGALDSETSIQVMNLLKEVAKDRLVIMVTHNPELAHEYATRIVNLKDGKIVDDSDEYIVNKTEEEKPKHKNMGKTSMSMLTSLSLSFNNLKTKKGRTLLTAFAGSIGIIGIALILSLSNGVNNYITNMQKDTMSSYPITIEKQAMDLSSVMKNDNNNEEKKVVHDKKDVVYSNGNGMEKASKMTSSFKKNNLTEFKKYVDDPNGDIRKYVGESGIVYSYDTKFGVYTKDSNGEFVNTDGTTLTDNDTEKGYGNMVNQMSKQQNGMPDFSMMTGNNSGTQNYSEILPEANGNGVSSVIKDNYDVIYGTWPEKYNEVILKVNSNNEIAASTLYQLGILPSKEYKDYMKKIEDGKEIKLKEKHFSYEELCEKELYLIPDCKAYQKNDSGFYTSIKDNSEEMEKLFDKATKLKIVGIVKAKDEEKDTFIKTTVGYTKDLTNFLIKETNNSDIVKAQEKNKKINVLNNVAFTAKNDKAKAKDAVKYIEKLSVADKANMYKMLMPSIMNSKSNDEKGEDVSYNEDNMSNLGGMAGNMGINQSDLSDNDLANAMDEYLLAPDENIMVSFYDTYIKSGSYEDNMDAFGVVDLNTPSAINIYTDSFEDKNAISDCITKYNETAKDGNKITYTDYIGTLLSTVTTIIDVISYVLIAFVAVSLVVSSIMIGIITFISVMERTKEIGILRAIGASKRNISQVFNAETLIIGLCSGVMGILISELLLVPINFIIHKALDMDSVSASLPIVGGIILVILSMILTFIGGLIPAKKAAKKDPVKALRTE